MKNGVAAPAEEDHLQRLRIVRVMGIETPIGFAAVLAARLDQSADLDGLLHRNVRPVLLRKSAAPIGLPGLAVEGHC